MSVSKTPITETTIVLEEIAMATSIPMSETGEDRSAASPMNLSVNVGDIERVVSVVGGGALALAGLRNLSSLSGMAMTLIGGSLVFRGVSGHCALYQQLGISSSHRHPATGVPAQHGRKIEKRMVINRPPEEVYRYWRNFENLPRFMEHLETVEQTGPNRSKWVAKGPLGTHVEWEAEIINERPNELIAWRSIEGSQVDTAGSVHFERAPGGRGTDVRVSLKYDPPAGKLGITIAKLFGQEPEQQISADLARLKQVLEAGEVATTSGQPSGRTPTGGTATGDAGGATPTLTRQSMVDEAADESFPASDPPAWTATSATDACSDVDRYK